MNWNPLTRLLTLSEGLLEPLNFPHVLVIARHGTSGIALYQRDDPRATGQERPVNYPGQVAPRLTIKPDLAETLALVPGKYFGWVADGAIYARPIGQGMPDLFYQVQQRSPDDICALAVLERNPRTDPAAPVLKRYQFIDENRAHAFAQQHGWEYAGEITQGRA